jgi:hypothetical protein
MGTVFWAIVSWWLFIAVISSFYFWAKKTDRSQAPLERRITAVGYGLAWPYLAYKGLKGKQNRTANLANSGPRRKISPAVPCPRPRRRRLISLSRRRLSDDLQPSQE